MGWTDERIELLKKLHVDGLSASNIAKQLGGGLSRNAVIGKIHRLGIQGQGRGAASAPKGVKPSRPVSARHLAPSAPREVTARVMPRYITGVAAAPAIEVNVVPFVETPSVMLPVPEAERCRHHCKWPIGDPMSPTYDVCGRPAALNEAGRPKPYCFEHLQVGLSPAKKQRPLDSLVGFAHKQDGVLRVKPAAR